MSEREDRGFWTMLGWFAFPIVPVVLARTYHQVVEDFPGPFYTTVHDPYGWPWPAWLAQLGPLIGFGFLAGATLSVSDERSGGRWLRPRLARRSFWVAVGPWVGFLSWTAIYCLIAWLDTIMPASSTGQHPDLGPLASWTESWTFWFLGWTLFILVFVTFTNAWLWPAIAAIRRARRVGSGMEAFKRGLGVALGFVGSLFGSFWAATQIWRDYFFDGRFVPLLMAMVSMAALSGCGTKVTYGEVRRRELFAAMLVAWTFGLSLAWRWMSRKSKPPTDPN